MSIRLKAQTEFLKYFVSIPAIDIGFDISFRTIVNFQEYESEQVKDGANIIFVESATNAVPEFYPPQIALTVDQRNYPELFFPQEPSVHDFLLGKQFNEVYTNITGKEKILFHYNHEFGIIGFKFQPAGNYWVFDRFE